MLPLEKLLARNLGCSRAEARALLAREGSDLPRAIAPADLPYTVPLLGGRSITLRDSFHLMLHKPVGCVTALADRTHPTALRYLAQAPLMAELRPVGRLDLDTTGLLTWTTDGEWLQRLTHPRNAIPRSYHAGLARPFAPLPANLVLHDGHRPNVLDLRPARADEMHPGLHRPADALAFATITIGGGAYHEIRRIFAALGSHVVSLCRVSFGEWNLPTDLAPGGWREVAREVMEG